MTKYFIPSENRIPFRVLLSLAGNQQVFLQDIEGIGSGSVYMAKNARSALFHLLSRLVVSESDELLLPAYTCQSVIESGLAVTRRLKFYDLNPKTLESGYDQIIPHINQNTRVLILQHLFGRRTSFDFVTRLKQMFPYLLIVEDSSQYFSLHQKPQADFLIWSFGRGKPLPAGFGGALVVNESFDKNLDFGSYARIGYLVPFVINCLSQVLSNPYLFRFIDLLIKNDDLSNEQTEYNNRKDQYSLGSNKRYEALLNNLLPHLSKINEHRQSLTRLYEQELGSEYSFDGFEKSSCIRYPVHVREAGEISKKLRPWGVRRMYIDHSLNFGQEMPGSTSISNHLLTLPTTLQIDEEIALRICAGVRELARLDG